MLIREKEQCAKVANVIVGVLLLGGFHAWFLRSMVVSPAERGRAMVGALMRVRRDRRVLRCIGRAVK